MPRYTFVLFHSQSGPWYEPGEVAKRDLGTRYDVYFV
jgi:hypothetical protein